MHTEEEGEKNNHRDIPNSSAFREFISSGWAAREESSDGPDEVAAHASARRAVLSEHFPGERLVIPAGELKVRSNDTDYPFRPHTAFAYLSGFGADTEPGAVLVLHPADEGGHDAVLYVRPPSPSDSEEFFSDARYGEFWVGRRPSLEEESRRLDIEILDIDMLAKELEGGQLRVVRDADVAVTTLVDELRQVNDGDEQDEAGDHELAQFISGQRLCKDEWEIEQMRAAIAATLEGFNAIVDGLPESTEKARGERWVEGLFGLHARHHGNGVGYDSICAAGDHANTIHWTRNTGKINAGDLILVDAGVEIDSLYTADVTRTLPVDGTFTDIQRKIYLAVQHAQEAGMAAVRPGNKFSDIHKAAIEVIASYLVEWGLLPEGVTVEDTLDKENGGWHRRWMVHGTSHHLGMDVHDCQLLLRSDYMDGKLEPGMILTVEPGLYFKADDLLVPEEYRGIGVRIEDDLLVTADGYENLSAAIPRTADDVEEWMAARR